MAVVIWLLPVLSFPIARDVPAASLSGAGFVLSIPFASLQRELFVALESVARRGTLCSFFPCTSLEPVAFSFLLYWFVKRLPAGYR